MKLRVARLLERSSANGPGERFVVWTAGCSLACPGCCNRELQDPRAGDDLETAELAGRIDAEAGLRGVTLSGGEPLEQPDAAADLLGRLKPDLDRVVFTGYSWEEVRADPKKRRVLEHADLVVAGRFRRGLACRDPWKASSNQTIHALTGRIAAEDGPDCRVEVRIDPAGKVALTGFPSPELVDGLNQALRGRSAPPASGALDRRQGAPRRL